MIMKYPIKDTSNYYWDVIIGIRTTIHQHQHINSRFNSQHKPIYPTCKENTSSSSCIIYTHTTQRRRTRQTTNFYFPNRNIEHLKFDAVAHEPAQQNSVLFYACTLVSSQHVSSWFFRRTEMAASTMILYGSILSYTTILLSVS